MVSGTGGNVVWVHDDAISRAHPVWERAGEGARGVWVYDDGYYRARGYSLKRIVFILECVEDAGFEVLEGAYADVLAGLGADTVFVARTPNPHFRQTIEDLRATTPVEVIKETAFAQLGEGADLRRFFRYWNKAKKSIMNR